MSKFSASRARSPFFVKILCGLRSKKPYFFFIKILCGRRSLSLFVKILCVPRSKKALFFFVKILCVPRPLSFFSSKSVRTLRRRAEALPARQSRHITARLFHKGFSVPVIPLCGRDSRRALIGVSARQKKHFIRSTAPKKYRARRRKKVSAAHLHPNAGARALRSFVPGPGAETGQAEAPKCRIWQKGAPKRRFSSRFALTIGPKYDTLYP